MSNRRGAPSMARDCVLRRKWYEEAQKKEFKGSDSSSSDDDVDVFSEEKTPPETKSATLEEMSEKEETDSKKKSNMPAPSRFTNFASALGAESSNRIDKVRVGEKSEKIVALDLDREIPEFDSADLEACLQRISSPLDEPRAILICCGGFGDNGRMFQEYGAYFERRGVQVLSFTFPGKLHRASEMFLSSLLEYMDWVLASLLHCGIVIKLDKGKRQGKLPDIPPVTLFGHDFGCVVAFELIRLLKKSKTVYMPVHHFIASACRPPEIISEFNSNEKSRKYSSEPADSLMARFVKIGFARPYMWSPGEERTGLLRLFLPCFRAEYRALETYNFKRSIGRQGPALECSLTVLGGSEDDFLGEGVAEQVLGRWREATSADCSVQVFAGAGHFYWKHSDELEEQFLESVVEKLFEADQRGGAGAKGPLDIVSSFTDALPDIAEE